MVLPRQMEHPEGVPHGRAQVALAAEPEDRETHSSFASASGPGVSKEIPEVAGRNLKIAGVHKGSIGEEHELRMLEA